MAEKLNIDPSRVEFDGHSFRLIVRDEEALLRRLQIKRAEIVDEIVKRSEEESLLLKRSTII